MKQVSIPPTAAGRLLSDYLSEAGHSVASPCGGAGVCGKCRVKVLAGVFFSRRHPEEPLPPDEEGCVPACCALCPQEGGVVALFEEKGDGLTLSTYAPPHSQKGALSGYGVALDLGTTTLAAVLVDRASGRWLASTSCLNPQKHFGADVISRIAAAEKGHLADLQRVVLESVRELIEYLTKEHPCRPEELVVAGNPTMLHLFAGISPSGMGVYPFTPAFLEEKVLSGEALALPVERVTLLPSASAFLGSDVLCGAALLRMTEQEAPTLLADIGTNGELLLCTGKARRNRLFAASTAAGPALEGANISCGIGGVAGAVSAVKKGRTPGAPVFFRTVGNAPAVGLCGSGLLDLCALLLEEGLLDETGYLEKGDYTLVGVHEKEDVRRFAQEKTPITLTGADIRELQLAKSALRAGVETLLALSGLSEEDIGKVYLAGGLGYYLNKQSACRIGLFPYTFLPVMEAVGNTSLAAAVAALCDETFKREAAALSARCETVELNRSAVFNEAFLTYMCFPDTDK